VPPPCFTLRRVANPQASQPREPYGRDPGARVSSFRSLTAPNPMRPVAC
jgi:hypothetical protein